MPLQVIGVEEVPNNNQLVISTAVPSGTSIKYAPCQSHPVIPLPSPGVPDLVPLQGFTACHARCMLTAGVALSDAHVHHSPWGCVACRDLDVYLERTIVGDVCHPQLVFTDCSTGMELLRHHLPGGGSTLEHLKHELRCWQCNQQSLSSNQSPPP